ncbi:TonB-dependent receptor [Marinoscillum sp. MHG1-6]|uniref:SusC/RagA family TonB-linked outer membrane protein n=1 Tax=Marinoscillum sp. MHG1-6 TaxID=2959627 RepID=UPI0021571AE7|nr:TonB-dependent receptor [Marinoscillum sp. MHG1-6]
MQRKFYRILSMLFVLLISTQVFGQEKLSGKVIDDQTGEGVPGATVMVKGTTNGTVTDFDGNYSLEVNSEDAVITVSFIGYQPMEEVVNGRSVINFDMRTDITELTEVIVVGYGTQKKKVVTGAIASVTSEQITQTPVLRMEQALQGRTPGVQVTNLSGQPGEAPTVRIRGAGTTGNAEPLYVVDGMVVGGIDFLNPGDIESIDVLKDAASAAIYGARAANGVVLITTKSGVKGQMNVSYSGYYGIQNVNNTLDMLNAEQYREFMNEGARNAGLTEPFDLNQVPAHDTDWQDVLFERNVPIMNHQITVSGGTDKSTYSSSLSYFSQQGIIGGDKSQFDRITARLNTSHKVNKIFSFGNNIAYSHIIRRGISSNSSFNGAYNGALNLDPLTPVYETDTAILNNQTPYADQPVVTDEDGNVFGISNYVGAEIVNPLALLANTYTETRVDKIVGNVYGEIEPISGLKLKTSYGIDLAYVLNDSHSPIYYLNGAQNRDISNVNKGIDRYFTWQWENTMIYTKNIGDHHMSGLLGITAQERVFENITGFTAGASTADPDNVYLVMGVDSLDRVGGGAWHSTLYSQFGRVTYDYKDKYLFTAILRRDGSSKFGPNKRFGIFPSIGVGWVASDEAFLQDLGPVNFLKLRGSWGVNGNQEIGDYQFVSTIDRTRGYLFGSGLAIGASPQYLENADIHWEESEQIDVALDFGLFDDKLTGSFDYYVKTTKGLLEKVPIPGHVGNEAPVSNAGSVENKGVEIALNWRSKAGPVNYTIGANAAYNKNTMTKIANSQGELPGATWGVAGQVTRAKIGLPIAYFWGYKTDGIFQSTAEVFQHINSTGDLLQPNAVAGDVRFVDVNGDGQLNDEDRTMIGNPNPDWTFGFNLSADYQGFDVAIFLQGSLGNDIFNGTQRNDLRYTNRTTAALDRWTAENPSNTTPRYTWIDTNNNERISDLYIEDGSFARLKNVQIGYNLPKGVLEKIGATNWRFYVSGENLLTFTNYSGADPEIGVMDGANGQKSAFNVGIDRGIYPQARTFRVGTTLTF